MDDSALKAITELAGIVLREIEAVEVSLQWYYGKNPSAAGEILAFSLSTIADAISCQRELVARLPREAVEP